MLNDDKMSLERQMRSGFFFCVSSLSDPYLKDHDDEGHYHHDNIIFVQEVIYFVVASLTKKVKFLFVCECWLFHWYDSMMQASAFAR